MKKREVWQYRDLKGKLLSLTILLKNPKMLKIIIILKRFVQVGWNFKRHDKRRSRGGVVDINLRGAVIYAYNVRNDSKKTNIHSTPYTETVSVYSEIYGLIDNYLRNFSSI